MAAHCGALCSRRRPHPGAARPLWAAAQRGEERPLPWAARAEGVLLAGRRPLVRRTIDKEQFAEAP